MGWKLSNLRIQEIKTDIDPIRIRESQAHCIVEGLDTDLIRPADTLFQADLEVFKSRYWEIRKYCQQLFFNLYRDVSDINCVFFLCDDAGRLISLGIHPRRVDGLAEELGLICGVSLSEESCGTNAIALALSYKEPMVTLGDDHYCNLFKHWCIVAVPILNANEYPVACIGIANCLSVSVGEKLALARFIARDLAPYFNAELTRTDRRISDKLSEDALQVNLTCRQRQVLSLFAKGMSYKEIAREIGIGSYKTVEEHLDAVRGKLHVSNRRECIHKAISLGIIKI